MKKKFWIPILSIISAIAIIISFNVMYNNANSANAMKSYDINDYEVIEIHYDNMTELWKGVHTEETEAIRSQFDSYDGTYALTLSLIVDLWDLCNVDNTNDGGYVKLNVATDKIVAVTDDDKFIKFGVYNGNEAYCNDDEYSKSTNKKNGKKTVESMKIFTDKLMSEKNQVITDESVLYEYTTILSGKEPEKLILDVDGKKYKGYDEIITKIEFIDQGETRLVKIDSNKIGYDEQVGNYVNNTSSYYKIVLKKDNNEFEKEYDEIYEQVNDVPYEE